MRKNRKKLKNTVTWDNLSPIYICIYIYSISSQFNKYTLYGRPRGGLWLARATLGSLRGGFWEPLGGFETLWGRFEEAPGRLLGAFGRLWEGLGRLWDAFI